MARHRDQAERVAIGRPAREFGGAGCCAGAALLSMTKDWLNVRLNWSADQTAHESVRAGANGTMKRTGLAGHAGCARATSGATLARVPSTNRRAFHRLPPVILLSRG